MNQSKFLALLAFIRDNVEGIQEVKHYSNAERALLTLADEGMSAQALLRRCGNYHFGDDLIEAVWRYFSVQGNDRRGEFVSALVQLDRTWLEENEINPLYILQTMSGHDVLAHMIKHHAELVLVEDEEHPFCCEGDIAIADDYWSHQVRRFIVKSNFRRAWDEMHKAHRGILNPTIQRKDFPSTNEFIEECRHHNRCWRASVDCVYMLALELHQAMCEQGEFVDSATEYGRVAFNALNEHFRQQRNERRRAKDDKKLTAYTAKKTT